MEKESGAKKRKSRKRKMRQRDRRLVASTPIRPAVFVLGISFISFDDVLIRLDSAARMTTSLSTSQLRQRRVY